VSKLTLSVNPAVVARAKRYAKRRGVSVSGLVEAYLALVTEPAGETAMPPILRSVRGTLRKAAVDDYRKHLTTKYR